MRCEEHCIAQRINARSELLEAASGALITKPVLKAAAFPGKSVLHLHAAHQAATPQA